MYSPSMKSRYEYLMYLMIEYICRGNHMGKYMGIYRGNYVLKSRGAGDNRILLKKSVKYDIEL